MADENVNGAIVRGLRRRSPGIDVVRVQDVGLSGATDPEVLAWAAEEGRVVLTYDVATMTFHAYERVEAGQRMPRVFQVPDQLSVHQTIEDLPLLADYSLEGEWEGQVRYLPL
ncbi:MAG: DUF5615 family PIN-like protein [Actinomycetota bacterium]